MRKILAVIFTIISLFAIRETFIIFTSSAPDLVKHRDQLILVSISLTVPLVFFTLWLWKPRYKQIDEIKS